MLFLAIALVEILLHKLSLNPRLLLLELVLNLIQVEVAFILLNGNRLIVGPTFQLHAFSLFLLALRGELVQLHMYLALVLAV